MCAVIALIYGVISISWVMAQPAGNARMQEIAAAIQQGAKAYLNRQYTHHRAWSAPCCSSCSASRSTGIRPSASPSARCCRAPPGYIGMNVSVRANVRTAQAAHDGMNAALPVAFRGGAITGMLVVGLGLLGVAGYYWLALEPVAATPTARCTRWSASRSAAR